MADKYFSFPIMLIALYFLGTVTVQTVDHVDTTGDPIECNTWECLPKEDKIAAFKNYIETGECEWKGIKLHGKVKFVDNFPDVKIEYVENFPDLKVKFVDNFPDDCGEWKIVEHFPDFTVKIVSSFPDLKVEQVTSFPGMQ